jgi:predicted acetyltransferase
LLNRHSQSGLPADHDVAEFFVVRKHRRSGVGIEAARQLICPRPGQWEIAVVRANAGALGFWRRVTASVSPEVDELNQNDARWNGVILRFKVA